VSASLPVMIRGLVPPIAGYLSYLLFNVNFSSKKILALVLSLTGITMGCFVQLYYETQAEMFKATGIGIFLIIVSAFTQATQHVLEERIYRREPYLTPLNMDAMEISWKNLLVWITIPIFSRVPVSN